MSKVVHRKPVWGWGVALLSTLLLTSPMAASALLHALAHASTNLSQQAFPNATAAHESPRRAEDESLAAAESERPHEQRLDPEPDALAAVVRPCRALVFVPDDAAPKAARDASFAVRSPLLSSVSSRAPPAV
jgi:hypothetical protein